MNERETKRPFSITILICGLTIVAYINLVRFIQAVQQWDFLNQVLSQSPLYLVVSGLFWFLFSLPLLWGLWKADKWAINYTYLAMVGYSIYYWLNHLWSVSGIKWTNWRFAAFANVLALSIIYWTLNRQKVQEYFGESHEP